MTDDSMTFGSSVVRVELLTGDDGLWRYTADSSGLLVHAPVFEVDGKGVSCAAVEFRRARAPRPRPNGVTEHRYDARLLCDPSLRLELVFRIGNDSPIIRFRYVLHSDGPRRLTRSGGRDRLTYLSVSCADCPRVTEVRLSEWNDQVHGYTLVERGIPPRDFEHELSLIGPLLVGESASHAMLVGYEHGATVPDSFLKFGLSPDREVALRAVKGNYWDGQSLDPDHAFETIWFQLAVVPGQKETLARAYRPFVLRHLSENAESRRPYIFYNTWNFQERNKHWHGRPYLESMNEARMLEEIEVAHRLGVEVFVIDTGWYEKTGDWRVSQQRFPNGLRPIKEKLDGYGMKLGLWFNPTVAAASSGVLQRHEDCVTSRRGKRAEPGRIWETEESSHMCLVSRYADAFVEESVRLFRELGVTYFKWDAVDQGGCDAPNHAHGGPEHTEQERGDCCAFRLGLSMADIAERVREACPEAIVDFDVTEAGRFVGLGWLAASKYFLVNNGPYYQTYNLPLPPDQNWNMFFYPGPARAWICRAALDYDRWIPSVLFMGHYLTDDPESSQLINIGSLILGQNGVWGDLPAISEEGVARFGKLLSLYKQVRQDITEAYPVRSGPIAGTPEIHEKVSERTGRGVVVVFSTRKGKHAYVTRHAVAETWWHTPGVAVTRDSGDRARLDIMFEEPGAQIVFFGVSDGAVS